MKTLSHAPGRSITLAVLTSLLPATVSAQRIGSLAAPAGRSAEPFSSVYAVRELSDGRVLVTDSREHAVHIVNFATGQTKQLGRNGDGPNEYRSTFSLVPMPGDSTYVYDATARRFFVIDPSGEPAGARAIGETFYAARSTSPPYGADAQGRLYFESAGLDQSVMLMRPIAQVVRWTQGKPTLDTVAQVAFRDPVRDAHRVRTFIMQDGWGVTAEGRIAHVVAKDYRVEWIRDGRVEARGRSVAYTPVRVTAAEREAFRAERALQPPGRARAVNPAGQPQPPRGSTPTRPVPGIPDEAFPDSKPPFAGSAAVRISPEGEVWVTRSRAWNDSMPIVDVFGADGNPVRQLRLPPRTRLVGFGARTIYLVRRDADDLEWLERYAR
jgi:hypothetical protein